MPTPKEIMEAERKRALEQAEQVAQDMRDLERIVSKYRLLVVSPEDSYASPSNENMPRSLFARAQEEGEAVIRTAGHPLPISELFQTLIDRGLEFGGQTPVSSLSTCLVKNARLRYIPQVGWWLRGVSWPPKPEEVGQILNPIETSAERGPRRRRRTPEKERLYQELRVFLEGKTDPTPFQAIFDHIKELGIPIGGAGTKQNLSAFMTSIHEFRTHGAEGRGGWTFVPDTDWSVVEGYKGNRRDLPKWLRTPMKQKLFESIREILKDRNEPLEGQKIFARLKELAVPIAGPGADEAQYFRSYMATVPCFEGNRSGYRYVPELDEAG